MKRFSYSLGLIFLALAILGACSPEADDTTHPTIQFTGGNPMYVKLGTPYKDSLVYFNDASGIATVWNDTTAYNPWHVGKYPVIYYAQDAYGNQTSATRYFVVRIEGSNLTGPWNGTRTEPWPGGEAQPYTDSLVNPYTQSVALSRFIPSKNIKIEMKNETGDTLSIPTQVVAYTDTSQTLLKGNGVVAGDGSTFWVNYVFITIGLNGNDTVFGRLDFMNHLPSSDTL